MNDWPIRVVKVGGSLFDLPDLGPRLSGWLEQQPPARNVLIAGGGVLADAIRVADVRFSLGQQTSHELCLDVLRVSARLLAAIVPGARLQTDWDELQTALRAPQTTAVFVFCPRRFILRVDPSRHPRPLPAAWAVTSDSIAARVAESLGATELVLVKSTDPAAGGSGYVDDYFATAAAGLANVRFVNLRREGE